MQNKIEENRLNTPYFIIDGLKNIVSFNLSTVADIKLSLCQSPQIGKSFVDIIPQQQASYISDVLDKCLSGQTIIAENDIVNKIIQTCFKFQFLFIPLPLNVVSHYAVCLIIPDADQSDSQFSNYNYSNLASHGLRGPVSNILSLANYDNYPPLKSHEALKIKALLKNIYAQAEKLNDVIVSLNYLINNDETAFAEDANIEKFMVSNLVLVDDDPLINKMHKMLLKKYHANITVVDFNSPLKALEHVAINHTDLIFLDINMPKIDGWEFLSRLKNQSLKPKVIILSSSIDPVEKNKAYSYDCVKDFISKPLTREKLNKLFLEDT
ncbi:response regulator [Mucilaginibacter sp.]